MNTSHTGLIPGHVSAADQVTGTMRPLTTMATLARGHAGAGAGVCRGRGRGWCMQGQGQVYAGAGQSPDCADVRCQSPPAAPGQHNLSQNNAQL